MNERMLTKEINNNNKRQQEFEETPKNKFDHKSGQQPGQMQ